MNIYLRVEWPNGTVRCYDLAAYLLIPSEGLWGTHAKLIEVTPEEALRQEGRIP